MLLLSGGIDSSALAVWKRPKLALTVDYGQRCFPGELRAARQVAAFLGLEHEVVRSDMARFGSGDMDGSPPAECAPVNEWWPFRNQLLITMAAVVAIKRACSEVMIGCVDGDGRHVDGSPPFIEAIDGLVGMQEGQVRVTAPSIGLSTLELLKASRPPNNVLRAMFSCHRAEYACGVCAGCRKAIATLTSFESLGSPA
ncbi:MAG TPA: 7-cyano-7-deazaguanine synthase [Candidatus Eremiobacteraceae bacterium]|nr:7-cyano-7-deazaguanine synthase [Candidatus Eremiobacteraceae bacterium]